MAVQLAAGRSLFAAAMFAAPVTGVRLLGADGATARRISWLSQMTAVRDGALGVGGLLAARNGAAGAVPWLIGGAISDTVDALAIAKAIKQGRLKGPGAVAIVPLAAGAAAVGLLTAARLRRS